MQRQILKPLSSEICMFRILKEIMHVFNQCIGFDQGLEPQFIDFSS